MKRRKWWTALSAIVALCMAMSIAACDESADLHKTVLHEAKAATCTEQGNDAYYSCSHCDKLFADAGATTEVKREDVFHAALGHDISDDGYVAGKPNSCTEAGEAAHFTCSRCHNAYADKAGTVLIEDTVLPARHSMGAHHTHVASTITSQGNIEYWECGACDKLFADEALTREIAQADTVLAQVPERDVTLTVKTYDGQGAITTPSAQFTAEMQSLSVTDGAYSLAVETNGSVTGTRDGEDSVQNKYAAGTYRIFADGYYSSEFTLADTDTQKEISLYALDRTLYNPNDARYVTAMRDGDGNKSFAFDKDYSAGDWNTLGMLELTADGGEQSYIHEFTVGIAQTPSNDWNNRLMFAFMDSSKAQTVQSSGTDVLGIGLALGNNNLMLYNLQQNWDARDNTPKEYGASDSSSSDLAFMSSFYRAAMRGTLRMRVVRLENTVSLYVNASGSWIRLRTATLSAQVKTDGFVVAACGNGGITVSQIDTGEYVEYAENGEHTVATLGHFEIGEKIYNSLGEDSTRAEIERSIITLGSFTVDPEEAFAEDIRGTLAGSSGTYEVTVNHSDNTVTNDGNSNRYVAGKYTFTAEGCFPSEIVIDETSAGQDAIMPLYFRKYKLFDNEKVVHTVREEIEEGKHNIHFDTLWNDDKNIEDFAYWEAEGDNGADNYRIEFTMQVGSVEGMNRYMNRLYFIASSYGKVAGYASLSNTVVFGIRIDCNGGAYTAVQKSDGSSLGTYKTEVKENPVKLCIARNGNKLSLYRADANGWTFVCETTLAQSDSGLTVGTYNSHEIVLSDIKRYTFVQGSTDSATGVITPDHFTDAQGNVYDINGVAKDSVDDLKINPVTPTSFVVRGLDGAANGRLSKDGTVIEIKIDASGNVTRKDNTAWYPEGEYTLTVFGYGAITVELANPASAVTGALEKITGVEAVICGSDDGKAKITETDGTYTLATPWDDNGTTAISDMGYLQLVGSTYTGNYSLEFTLTGGRGNGTTRIYFAAADYEKVQTYDITTVNNTNPSIVGISTRATGGGDGNMYYSDLHERYRDDQSLNTATTRNFKIERKGNVMTMYFLQNGNWVQLHAVTLTEDKVNNGLGIFGTAGNGGSDTIAFSNIVFTPIED